jgi:hypothetical protein
VGDAAKTHEVVARDYRARGVIRHAVNVAKGVLIGAIVVIALWLVLG